MLAIFDDYMLNFNRVTNYDVINDFADLCILMDKWADSNKQAHSIKSYYALAKSINGFDLLDENEQLRDHYARQDEGMVFAFTGTEEIKNDNSIIEALKDVAKWYVENVFTYQGDKYYDSFMVADRENGISNHQMYMLGTGIDERIEFLQDDTANVLVLGGNYSHIGQKAGSDTEIKKKEGDTINIYYFKRMTDNLNEFIYDWFCYIKASKTACENNREYTTKEGSKLKYYTDCDPVAGFEYNDVGDDCARFAFAVLELGTGEDARNLVDLGDDASQFVDVPDTIANMKSYFDFYTGEYLKKIFNNEFTGEEAYKNGIQPGDMLVGSAKTSGNGDRNHCEFIKNYDKKVGEAKIYNAFGWGSVKKDDNSQMSLTLDGNYLKNSFDGNYKYSALYRKKVK